MALEMLELPKKRGGDVKLSGNKIIFAASALANEELNALALASAEYVNLGYDKDTREIGIEPLEEGVIGHKLGKVRGGGRVVDATPLFKIHNIDPTSVDIDGTLRHGTGVDQKRFLFGLSESIPRKRRGRPKKGLTGTGEDLHNSSPTGASS